MCVEISQRGVRLNQVIKMLVNQSKDARTIQVEEHILDLINEDP